MSDELIIYNSISKVGETREYRIHAEQVVMDNGNVLKLQTMREILKGLTVKGLIEWIIFYEPQSFDLVIKIRRLK